jgi:hypothetical protein
MLATAEHGDGDDRLENGMGDPESVIEDSNFFAHLVFARLFLLACGSLNFVSSSTNDSIRDWMKTGGQSQIRMIFGRVLVKRKLNLLARAFNVLR